MIYVDTSVMLAQLLAEDRRASAAFWEQPLISSRLVCYEAWTRVHARRLQASHGEAAEMLLSRIALAEMTPTVLARAQEPFPTPVRTLDGLHLATFHFLQSRLPSLRLATFDARMSEAAARLGFAVETL